MLFNYSVYGLQLQANRRIPGLVSLPHSPRVDVQVSLEMPAWVRPAMKTARTWYASKSIDKRGDPFLRIWELAGGHHFHLVYGDGTEFLVDRLGTQIWATWPDELTLEDTATYLLGPVLGFVLRLRDITCLHA